MQLKLPWKSTKCANIHLVVLWTSIQKHFIWLSIWAAQGAAVCFNPLPMQSRERLLSAVFGTSATCSCQACLKCGYYRLFGTKRQHSWSYFCDFETVIFDRHYKNLSEKQLRAFFSLFFPSKLIFIKKASETSSFWAPFNSQSVLTVSCLLWLGPFAVVFN